MQILNWQRSEFSQLELRVIKSLAEEPKTHLTICREFGFYAEPLPPKPPNMLRCMRTWWALLRLEGRGYLITGHDDGRELWFFALTPKARKALAELVLPA